MSTATDTFADFVEHLAEAFDDHATASGDHLARRFHFSRFHFDRMIASVAGEPPQTFRRRILLERAAYRMVTTSAPLIDVAMEAGYASHEAFTRAFTKAYGVAPATWRRKSGHLQIEAPSGVHFHPPGGLRLPARLVGQMGMWNAAMATRDYDWSVEEHESLSSMRQRLATEGSTYLGHVHDVVAGNRLDDTVVDALCEPADVFTYGGMIAHVLTFAAHRRTLVALALGTHGIDELGWGDPMLWVAQPA